MSNQLTYVFFAYLFTFTVLLLIAGRSYIKYLINRKKLNNLDTSINNR